MRKRVPSLRCPTCRKLVVRGEPDYPFCSERCRLIDLGKWASGAYVISSPIQEADQFGEGAALRERAEYTVHPPKGGAKPDGKLGRS